MIIVQYYILPHLIISLTEDLQILADHGLKSLIKGFADHGMADRDLIQLRDVPMEECQIVETKVVTGIDSEPQLLGTPGTGHKGLDSLLRVRRIQVSIGLRIHLHSISPYTPSSDEILQVSVHKD